MGWLGLGIGLAIKGNKEGKTVGNGVGWYCCLQVVVVLLMYGYGSVGFEEQAERNIQSTKQENGFLLLFRMLFKL